MKKILTLTLMLAMMIFVTACGNTAQNTTEQNSESTAQAAPTESNDATPKKKNLIVFFSRTGDNYEVGTIEKGNTHIVADFIAENVDADIFEIKPITPYPEEYRACTEFAKKEKAENARPQFAGLIENFADYETIYLGYPVWWSDLPMVVYTFLENYDFNGKKIIPFCTSANNHFLGKEDIAKTAKGATVLDGLGIRGKRCQDDPESVKTDVVNWLKKING